MVAIRNLVRKEDSATPEATSPETIFTKIAMVFKGALIVSAVGYVTITWALQAAARFN